MIIHVRFAVQMFLNGEPVSFAKNCNECSACGPCGDTEEDAEKKWKTRAAPVT